MSNRLARETSPYLRQHADNPVDWYPWGPEALARARELDRPILLSIGYAACHWCHVMAHESFEDPDTARLMNAHFVNIKVDREERPDLDSIYMQAVQAMSGHGGWPMTVFLTPFGDPFWGGTYFPPDDRHGLPSFRRVLSSVADAYDTRPEQIQKTVSAVRALYDSTARVVPAGALSGATFDRAFHATAGSFDAQRGGFGGAPKFPSTMLLEFLLAHWARTGERHALDMSHTTHRRMAEGGIRDHVGGGFHRYAVDAEWLVPHFEKMLYDNALLARFGAHLWQATGDPAVRTVTEQVLGWVAREMTSPEGGFYSSLDADSDGEEGRFYTWTAAEFASAAGADAERARSWFGVTDGGNFEGRNILHTARDAGPLPPDLEAVVARLLAARAERVRPGLDDKIVASWNGLMLRSIATCARVFSSAAWTGLAQRNARFLDSHISGDGRVARILVRGGAAAPGFLEDHAALGLAFFEVWQLTHDRHWLDRARLIMAAMLDHFWGDDLPGFHDVPHDHEPLITRPRDLYDNATPAGSSLAVELMLRLAYVTGDSALARRAESALAPFAEPMARHPHAFGYLLSCADLAFHGATALAVVGDRTSAASLLAEAASVYLPSFVTGAAPDGADGDLTLFANRDSRGAGAAAYVCRGHVCDAPATTPHEVREQLLRILSAHQ